MPRSRKRLLAEATIALFHAAWLVRRRAFRSYAPGLGTAQPGESADAAHGARPAEPLGEVRWALRRVNRLARGRFTCLMLAMAGQRLLTRRGFGTTLVLGVRPDKGRGDDPFGAHAWLLSGGHGVVGLKERAGHIPVVSYHVAPQTDDRRGR